MGIFLNPWTFIHPTMSLSKMLLNNFPSQIQHCVKSDKQQKQSNFSGIVFIWPFVWNSSAIQLHSCLGLNIWSIVLEDTMSHLEWLLLALSNGRKNNYQGYYPSFFPLYSSQFTSAAFGKWQSWFLSPFANIKLVKISKVDLCSFHSFF